MSSCLTLLSNKNQAFGKPNVTDVTQRRNLIGYYISHNIKLSRTNHFSWIASIKASLKNN